MNILRRTEVTFFSQQRHKRYISTNYLAHKLLFFLPRIKASPFVLGCQMRGSQLDQGSFCSMIRYVKLINLFNVCVLTSSPPVWWQALWTKFLQSMSKFWYEGHYCQAQGQTWNPPPHNFFWSVNGKLRLGKGQGKVRWWSEGQVNCRWTPGEHQVNSRWASGEV